MSEKSAVKKKKVLLSHSN